VGEPPCVEPLYYSQLTKERFGKIFVLLDDYVDNETYFKVFHQFPPSQMHRVAKKDFLDFEEKKFCCMINSNKYFYNDPGEIYT
jgi:hypothetical protein